MMAKLYMMNHASAGTGDLAKYYPLNLEYHRTLFEFAGNPRLLAVYQSFVQELDLFRPARARARRPHGGFEHGAPPHFGGHCRARRRGRIVFDGSARP